MEDKQAVIDHEVQTIMQDLLHRAKFAKTEMCKEMPMTDNPPIMLITVESDETNPEHDTAVEFQREKGLTAPLHIAMLPLMHKEDIYDAYDDVVRAMPIRKFRSIILALEGYGTSNPELLDKDDYERGDMEDDYKNNPFSDVREALVLTGVDWDTTKMWSIMQTYRYDDHGVPIYDEPACHVTDLSDETEIGRLGDTLVSTARYMNLAVKTTEFHALLARATADKEEDK